MRRPRFDLSDPDAVKFCPACGAGYGPQRSRCADCDVALLPRSVIENGVREKTVAGEEMDPGPIVSFYTAERIEAEFLGAELERAGIPFFTKEHQVQGIHFGGLKTGAVEFFVPEDKLEEAENVLDSLESLADESTESSEDEEGGEPRE